MSNIPLSILNLILLTALTILFYRLLRLSVNKILQPISRKLAIRYHGERWELDNREKVKKFAESGYKLISHTLLTAWGYLFLSTCPYYHHSPSLWTSHSTYTLPPLGYSYYIFQLAYNLEAFLVLLRSSYLPKPSFPYLRLNPERRGDFREMIVHHFVTNALLGMTIKLNIVRIGTIVLYQHDASDIMIDVSKMFNFLKLKIPTALSFLGILATWIYYRLYLFPTYVIASAINDTYEVGLSIYTPFSYYCYKSLCVSLLLALLTLHVYWFWLFVRMAHLLMLKFEPHDLSVHKNGESYELERRGAPQAQAMRGRCNSGSLSTHDLPSWEQENNGIKRD